MNELTILEQNARRAKEMSSFSDYRSGSATSEYQSYCKEADEIAQRAKERLAEAGAPADRAEKVDYLLTLYKSKKLSWLNDLYANRARVPSVMITGPAKFPVKAKERQNAREDALMEQNPDQILDEIRGVGRNAGTIYSDDKDAVERIKEKIAALEAAPRDRWGYNKTEIRRLKERLLSLAPEEFAEQQANISIDGAKTYEEIVALWNNGNIHKSTYQSSYEQKPHWYYDLPLNFTDGKRHYKEYISIEVDEAGENRIDWNHEKQKTDLFPLTDKAKYSFIIGKISGSGNKAVIYQYLRGLSPEVQAKKTVIEATEQPSAETVKTVTINGEAARVVCNKEDLRLQLIFEGKPGDKTREILKSNGFRWAPSAGAWQRLLNSNAEYALRRITDKKEG